MEAGACERSRLFSMYQPLLRTQDIPELLKTSDVSRAYKLEQLRTHQFAVEKRFKDNKGAVEALQNLIASEPDSDEREQWDKMLEINQHDLGLHQSELNIIADAIESVRSATDGKQLPLF